LQAKRRRYSPFGIIDWLANRGETEGGRKRLERNGLLLVPSSTVVCGLNLRSLFKTADTLTTGRKRRRRGIGARHSVSLNPSLSYSVGGDRARNRVSARAESLGGRELLQQPHHQLHISKIGQVNARPSSLRICETLAAKAVRNPATVSQSPVPNASSKEDQPRTARSIGEQTIYRLKSNLKRWRIEIDSPI
jgi:hypothetical protein